MSEEKLNAIDELTNKGFGKVDGWSIDDVVYLVACTKALREIAKDTFEDAKDIVIEAQIVSGINLGE